jgi:hypothetical protein
MTTLTLWHAHSRVVSCPRLSLAQQWLPRASRLLAVCLLATSGLLGLYAVVPAYMSSQASAIAASAIHQGVPPSWLAAVFYNEILGTEDTVLQEILPGDSQPLPALRQVLLGLHFCTLKQVQWQTKTVMALLGSDPTVGPAGIRVTVGRQIQREVGAVGGRYIANGWLERPSMVLDLINPPTALEYLAGNLRRGQERLAWAQRGDWAASARWHNTGVVYDSEIVRPEDWEKGTRYIARVEEYLSEMAPLVRSQLPPDLNATGSTPGALARDGQAARRPLTSVVQ